MKALCSTSKIFKFMVKAANISIDTLVSVWILDWSASFIHFLILYIFQIRFQDFVDMTFLLFLIQPLSFFKWYKNM